MKIAVSASSPELNSAIDSRFGRAAYFVVVDVESLKWQAHRNPAAGAQGGAGTRAAQFVVDQGAQAVLSGDFGPNAHAALSAAGIAMHLLGASLTVREAVEHFKAGRLSMARPG
jgi:predicted Fe-Mo cluster-binding NifX family protein